MDEEKRKAERDKMEKERKQLQAACKHKHTKNEYVLGKDTGYKICLAGKQQIRRFQTDPLPKIDAPLNSTCGLRISDNPTSDNLTTTNPDVLHICPHGGWFVLS